MSGLSKPLLWLVCSLPSNTLKEVLEPTRPCSYVCCYRHSRQRRCCKLLAEWCIISHCHQLDLKMWLWRSVHNPSSLLCLPPQSHLATNSSTCQQWQRWIGSHHLRILQLPIYSLHVLPPDLIWDDNPVKVLLLKWWSYRGIGSMLLYSLYCWQNLLS